MNNRQSNSKAIPENSDEDLGQAYNYQQDFLDEDQIEGAIHSQHPQSRQTQQQFDQTSHQHQLASVLASGKFKNNSRQGNQSPFQFKKSNSFSDDNPTDQPQSLRQEVSTPANMKPSQLQDTQKLPTLKTKQSSLSGKSASMKESSMTYQKKLVPQCQIHQIDITLICCVSQWHCEALCIDCIPQHTESHNRNRTQPVLKKFDQAKLECAEKCILLREQLTKCQGELVEIMEHQYSDQNLVNLQMWRISMVQIFEVYFDQMEQEYTERAMQVYMEQQKKLNTVNMEVEKVLNDIQSFENDLNSLSFFVKGIANTLKINVQSFVTDLYQEIRRIQDAYTLDEELKLNSILVKYLHGNIGRLITIETPSKEDLSKNTKKDDFKKLKMKSTNCPGCGNQMTYVSEFKKHLECIHCSKVKRPNVKDSKKYN